MKSHFNCFPVVPDRVVVNCSDSPSTVPDRPCSQVDSPVRISCSVTSSPKSEIKWTTKPDGCSEVESKYCSAGDSPSVCVSELEDLCAGTYACQVMYDNNIVQKDIPGGKVTVNGKGEYQVVKGSYIDILISVDIRDVTTPNISCRLIGTIHADTE